MKGKIKISAVIRTSPRHIIFLIRLPLHYTEIHKYMQQRKAKDPAVKNIIEIIDKLNAERKTLTEQGNTCRHSEKIELL